MSDFFDNESEIEKPEQENSEKKRKKKNDFTKIIVYVICLSLVVGGCFLAKRFIPKKRKASTPASESNEIKLLSLGSDAIKSVTVQNAYGTLSFYGENGSWYIEGITKEKINTAKTASIVEAAGNISAIKEVTEKMTVADAGLDNPEIKAEILKSDDTVVSFCIGKDSSVGNGCYFKNDDNEKIFLIDNIIKDDLGKDALSLAESKMPAVSMSDDISEYFQDGKLYNCDSITVTGKNYPEPLVVVKNDDPQAAEYIPYKIKSPDNHLAENIDKLFEWFGGGITADGAYSYGISDFARYGLNDPDISATIQIKNKTHTFKLAKQDDETYAGWCSARDMIYKIKVSDDDGVKEIVNSKASYFYSSLVCLYSIDDLTDFVIKTADNTYSFAIKANSDQNSADKYVVKTAGRKVDCKSFQNLYEYIITLSCEDFNVKNVKKGEKITFEFHLKNGGVDSIEFVRASDTRYEYSENGKAMGQISSTRIIKTLKYASALANGETLPPLG
ncbi:MAG TPA: hypothetical protein DEW35_05985 [Ruminococcaceae bacterium]|nr:hypothetical protein [Oscillospiraceae bacterium]